MPIAAVVDSKIFCVHGGIPPPWMAGGGYISHLDRVANSIRDPEENEPLVWEYLWNDPLQHNMALPPDVEIDRTGFVHNFRCVSIYDELIYDVLIYDVRSAKIPSTPILTSSNYYIHFLIIGEGLVIYFLTKHWWIF